MKVEYSPDAEKDLSDILDYIFTLNPLAALDYYDEVTDFINNILSKNPKIGKHRAGLLSGVRAFPIRNHIVLYDVDADYITINRIIHGARDLSALN